MGQGGCRETLLGDVAGLGNQEWSEAHDMVNPWGGNAQEKAKCSQVRSQCVGPGSSIRLTLDG